MEIKELRLKLKMSQSQFATHYSIPLGTLKRWEQGQSKPPIYLVKLLKIVVNFELKGENDGKQRRNNDIS